MAQLARNDEHLVEGTFPVTIRHKHDGCWELYQDNADEEIVDIVHIEAEDMRAFMDALYAAWDGGKS